MPLYGKKKGYVTFLKSLKYSGLANAQCNIDPHVYSTLFPLFVFDVSKQSDRLKSGIVDVTVKMNFSANVSANTQAYAMVLCDRIVKFHGDSSKMNIVILGQVKSEVGTTFLGTN